MWLNEVMNGNGQAKLLRQYFAVFHHTKMNLNMGEL